MDVNDLRHFMAVYESGGFMRASKIIGTVQSNVSGRIRVLEKFLGVPLFERRYRATVPTESANRLYVYAKQVMELLDQAAREIRPPAQ